MRTVLAANRRSGGGLDPAPLAEAMRAAGAEVEVTGCDGAALAAAARARPERLAVAGGDGTLGPWAELAGRLGVPLAVIPAGTANDFARAHGLPLDRLEAARLAVRGDHLAALELGRLADGRPFVNAASAGLAVEAARRARALKRRLGPAAYAVGALRAAVTGSPVPLTVRVDGAEVFSGGAWQVIVAATGAFGGGAGVGAAEAGDGLLDVVVLPAGSRLGLARRAWGLRRREVEAQEDVPHHRGAVVEVGAPPGTPLNADGELRDSGLDRITVERAAYALVLPGAATSTPSRPPRLTS